MVNKKVLGGAILAALTVGMVGVPSAQFVAKDPGVRGGNSAGQPLPGLSAAEMALFTAGQTDFNSREDVGDGLGVRFNLDSCGGCHAAPAAGGSSPKVNPQFALFSDPTFGRGFNSNNNIPSFITKNGPTREARFVKNPDGTNDGGVHALFVITGLSGTAGCNARQEDFETQVRNKNIIFRIPTPTFGLGLVEAIPDSQLIAAQAAAAPQKATFGIGGRFNRVRSPSSTAPSVSGDPNRSGNDGTITKFGWKAQNKSLIVFSGEAYNVEMGISNEAFGNERDENPTCQFAPTPNDTQPETGATVADSISAIAKFSIFMRFLDAPRPSPDTPGGAGSIGNGSKLFTTVGCALCHEPSYKTGNANPPVLANKTVRLYSDLMIHAMGTGLADGVSQGGAGPDEFRTAPLWGVGQRIFFLHDGRTSDLAEAIQQHKSTGSEANGVIDAYNALREGDKQDVLNFLRSL